MPKLYYYNYIPELKNNRKNDDINHFPKMIEVNTIDDLRKVIINNHCFGDFSEQREDKFERNGWRIRHGKNWKSCDWLFADIDNTNDIDKNGNPIDMDIQENQYDIDKITTIFNDYSFYAVPSKSHMKGKTKSDGSKETPRPKYHIYFPLNTTITDFNIMQEYLVKLTTKYTMTDIAVKDPPRFFYATDENVDIIYHEGTKNILHDLDVYQMPKALTVITSGKTAIAKTQKKEEIEDYSKVQTGQRTATLMKVAGKDINKGWKLPEILKHMVSVNAQFPEPHDYTKVEYTANDAVKRYGTIYTDPESCIIKNYESWQDDDGVWHMKSKIFFDSEMIAKPATFLAAFAEGAGHRFLFDQTNPNSIIEDVAGLHTVLQLHKVGIDFAPGALNQSNFMSYLSQTVPSYERFSVLPEIKNCGDTIYFPYEADTPADNGEFLKLLNVYSLYEERDKYRFAAGLLSGFLDSSYDGKIPITAMRADDCSNGKTSIVTDGVYKIQGIAPITMHGTTKDDAAIGGIYNLKNKYVLYDNIQNPTKDQLLKITIDTTNKYRDAWFFGKSHAMVKNNKVPFATFNGDEAFNRDILHRINLVTMRSDVTTDEKVEIEKALKEIDVLKVRANLLWVIDQWKSGNMRKNYTVKRHVKFSLWSDTISELVSFIFKDVKEFDFTLSDTDKKYDALYGVVHDFVTDIMEGAKSKFISNDDVLMKYRKATGNASATTNSITRQLTRYAPVLTDYNLKKDIIWDSGKTIRGWKIDQIEVKQTIPIDNEFAELEKNILEQED